MLSEGLNRVRDLVNADITHAQAGTDNTLPSENDTGLYDEVTSSLTTTTNSVSSNPATINVEHIITSAAAVGETLKEWELRLNSNAESFNRTVTAGFTKTSTQETTRNVTIEITQE